MQGPATGCHLLQLQFAVCELVCMIFICRKLLVQAYEKGVDKLMHESKWLNQKAEQCCACAVDKRIQTGCAQCHSCRLQWRGDSWSQCKHCSCMIFSVQYVALSPAAFSQSTLTCLGACCSVRHAFFLHNSQTEAGFVLTCG